ncbi:MAG: signal peptidase II [Candidatus Omnitrophica bacterium]|nr:signal peptidase II [Candidatus Omnitrophota bacterium]
MIGSLIVVADQLTKRAVVAAFHPGESLPLLSPILHLTYVQNTGAAFGLFKGQQTFFIITSLLVIAWVVWELLTKPAHSRRVLWGCALIWGGAIGNLIDRVRLGYVIDFFDLRVWPVFNVGDSAITIGVGLLILDMLRTRRASPPHP